jgi:flavin-binding protein dodecin
VPITTVTTEITVTSMTSPEDAVRQATAMATDGLNGVESVEVKQVEVLLEDTNVAGYRVTLEVRHGRDGETATERERDPHGIWSRSYPAAQNESQLELVRNRMLLEDLTQEELDASDRFLAIAPAERGSGSTDVSVNHDRHLFDD